MRLPLLVALGGVTCVSANGQQSVAYVMGRTDGVDLFATFDVDENGLITHDEFVAVGRHLHQNRTILHLLDMFRSEDINHDGLIQFNEFDGPKDYVPFKLIFSALDHNDDGWLYPSEYANLVPKEAHKYGSLAAVQKCDFNNDNRLSQAEFAGCGTKHHDVLYHDVHFLRMEKFSVLVNTARDSGDPNNSTLLGQTDDAMRRAAHMLEPGALSFKAHPNFAVTFKPSPTDDASVTVPLVFHLLELYTRFKLHSIRQLLLLCLRAGANPTSHSPWTLYRPPPLLSVFWKLTVDTELIAAFIEAGHNLEGLSAGEPFKGWSLLHLCLHSTEINIVKKLFIVADQFAISDELDNDRKSVADIFRATAATGVKRNDWQGDLYHVDYLSLLHASPTFSSLVEDWNANGPTDFIDRGVSHAINEEASMANYRLLVNGGLDITELAMAQPTDGWNVLHLLVHFHYGRCIKLLFNEVEFQARFTVDSKPQNSTRRAEVLRAAHRALRQTDGTLRRTPAHFAAAFFGNSSVLQVLEEARHMVDRLVQQYNVQLTDSRAAPSDRRDILGNLPSAYVDKSASWRIPKDKMPPDFFLKAKSFNSVGNGDSAIDKYRNLQQQQQAGARAGGDSVNAAPAIPVVAADGGWGKFFGVRSDLESEPPDRCDIKEMTTMPSAEQWAELIMAGEPFIVRNGAEQLGLRRHLWERENFMAMYGDQEVRVGKIPYQRSFASYVARDAQFQHNPMDDVVTLREFVASFHEHGGADATGVPNYLFTTKFTTDNPSLMETCAAAFDFAMNVGALLPLRHR
jgi:hypothetical protein